MLSYARSYKGNITYKKSDAENTGLKKASINLIIIAQAFHWFNINSAVNEFLKIIKPGGSMCAFWNVREETPFSQEYKKLILKYSKDYKKIPSAKETILAIKKFPGITNIKTISYPYFQKFDLKGLIGRAYSTSYIVYGVDDHQKFKDALNAIFKKYELEGRVEFKYQSLAILWKFS
jgi:SAM-dependent methyltransferase